MCGIAGIVVAGAAPVDRDVLSAMTASLGHRGPDAQGTWLAPGVGLGHRRLSILDLSDAAAQPMQTPDGKVVLTFNGEIYNFAELRRRLLAAGETFTSSGDTEVLVRLLALRGRDALDSVEGMFAIGCWDASARTLLLCRDRYGEKPLYYAPFGPEGREGLAFASEPRALLLHPRVRQERAVDPAALGQYLLHQCVPAPRSIFANVRKLLPGQLLVWRDGAGYGVEQYYRPSFNHRRKGDPRALAGELFDLACRSTTARLVADVPVGVFLSGGLDSSLIAACAARSHRKIKTFTLRFDEPSYDEGEHARAVANHLGTDHVEAYLSTQEMLDQIPSMLDWMDEPLADSSLLPTTLLARAAASEVKVALSGDGGDDVLAGYPTFLVGRALRAMPALPPLLARALRGFTSHAPPSDESFSLGFKLRQLSQGLGVHGARRHAGWLAPFVPEDLAHLLTPDLARSLLPHAWDAVDASAAETVSEFDAATAFYLRVYLGEGVLTKVDRASMRTSLEVRAPLLDRAFVEFCLGLDPSLLLRGMSTKWLLRRALRPLLPAAIVARPKKGFGSPVGAWLRGPLQGFLRDTLSRTRLEEAGWFQPGRVDAMVQAHIEGRRDYHRPLYTLLVLEHWRRRWLV